MDEVPTPDAVILPSISAMSTFTLSLLKACGIVLFISVARGLAWLINMIIMAPILDPLKAMQGPDGSLLQNHFRELMEWVSVFL